MAMSANGMIADKEGKEEFLSDLNWKTFSELVSTHKNIIVGRKTYESVKEWGEQYSFDHFTAATKVILTRNAEYVLPEGYFRAFSPKDALKAVFDADVENALIAGGASVSSGFAKEGLLNEIILNIEPAMLGNGIPLFNPDDFELKLSLMQVTQLEEGIVQLRYTVAP